MLPRGDGDNATCEAAGCPAPALVGLSAALAEHREALQDFLATWFDGQEALLAAANALPLASPRGAHSGVLIAAPDADSSAAWRAVPEAPVILAASEDVSPNLTYNDAWSADGGRATNMVETKPVKPPEASEIQRRGSKLNAEEVLASVHLGGTMKHMSNIELALAVAVERVHLHTGCALCHTAEKIQGHRSFHTACSVVIMLNAAFLIFATEYRLTNYAEPEHLAIDLAELCFCCFYTSELLLKLIGQRLSFFVGEGHRWNLFDVVLVLLSMFETVTTFAKGVPGFNLSYLRVLRLVKMLKLLRFVRIMRQFRELRLVLDSILGSMKCMWYAVVLTAIIALMFSLCFAQAVMDLLIDRPHAAEDELEPLLKYWGSIGTSMVSLFQAGTGGESWAYIAEPLLEVGIVYYGIFILYVSFFQFVFMNSMTSVFVDSMQVYSETAAQDIVRDHMDRRQDYVNTLVAMFGAMDSDGSGEVSFHEFKSHLGKPEMLAFAASLDLEVFDLEQFFAILSANGSRPVDLQTFVVSCIKLRGSAQRIDVTEVRLQQENALFKLDRLQTHAEAQLRICHQRDQILSV